MKSRLLLVASFAVFISGCIKEEDFDFTDITFSSWNPEVALPLVNASLGYSDVSGLSSADQLTVDPTGRIVITRSSTIFERTGKSFFTIPDQQSGFAIPIDAVQAGMLNNTGSFTDTISQDILFVLPAGQRLDKAILTEGTVEFQVLNQLPIDGNFEVSIPSLQISGVIFNTVFVVPALTVRTFSLDVSGYTLDISGSIPANNLKVDFILGLSVTGVAINPGVSFDIISSINAIDYSYLEGNLGIQDFAVPLDTVPLDIYGSGTGDIYYLNDPRLNLLIENSIGVPSQLANCLVQPIRKDGIPIYSSLLPTTSSYIIDFPAAPGQIRSTEIPINSQNSSIVSSYAARPASVVYRADVGLNRPQIGNVNFITDTSKIRVNLESELPLSGYAEQLTILDTAEFNLTSIKEIDSLVFRIETRNGMPVSGRLQVLFLKNGIVTDSLFHVDDFYIIEATPVDANGFAIGANINVHDESINSGRLDRFYEADQVVFRAVMNTFSPPTPVAIRQADHLDIKLGVRVNLNLKFD
ncbi:MAG: hypothetical protein ACKOQ6_04055 [Bacteroidota bacterium]